MAEAKKVQLDEQATDYELGVEAKYAKLAREALSAGEEDLARQYLEQKARAEAAAIGEQENYDADRAAAAAGKPVEGEFDGPSDGSSVVQVKGADGVQASNVDVRAKVDQELAALKLEMGLDQ
ncbi:hypothetical protein [Adlercreutzia aquisgranensis]|uniref:Uncharacterized protein n=1 Tax=Muribaculaceae bacterium Z82 TaxID=2304548 RepID=A0A7C9N9J7_9BACT|nr:hypothetical protein [Adlercreutzia aquisgranensis]